MTESKMAPLAHIGLAIGALDKAEADGTAPIWLGLLHANIATAELLAAQQQPATTRKDTLGHYTWGGERYVNQVESIRLTVDKLGVAQRDRAWLDPDGDMWAWRGRKWNYLADHGWVDLLEPVPYGPFREATPAEIIAKLS